MVEGDENPYQAPRSEEGALSGAGWTGVIPPEGSYHLQADDVAEAVRARSGRVSRVVATILVALLVAALALQLVTGNLSGIPTTLFFLALLLAGLLLGPWFAGRALRSRPSDERELRILLDAESVTVADATGNSNRLVWRSIAGRRETERYVFLELSNKSNYILPRRAWGTSEDFENVRALVAAHVPLAKRGGCLTWIVLSWLLLILMMIAIWNFFADVPRTNRGAPSSSAS